MNAFRRWLRTILPLLLMAAAAAGMMAIMDPTDRPIYSWLMWSTWMGTLIAMSGQPSRPCRRPRWLGGRGAVSER